MPLNPLTQWLACHFPESSPVDFYRELFPAGALASEEGQDGWYSGVLVRVLRYPGEPERAERQPILDDLLSVRATVPIAQAMGGEFDIVSPVSYAGRRPMLDRAHELFAVVFDLDGVKVEGGRPVGIEDLFFQMEEVEGVRGALLPTPTYVVSSGSGLHLYYMLDRPLRMWPNVCERMRLLRNSLTRRCWNQYVTDLSREPQMEGVVQGFRMVGSMAKDGRQVVRAFRTGGRVSIDDLNAFVPEEARVTADLYTPSRSVEEARAMWPEWDPEWRRKAMLAPKCPWRVKRDLYDWWCRRVDLGEPFEGNRYWCLFVAACFAAKCPDVTYEELEAWAHGVRPLLDGLTKREGNHFTEKDVQDAISVYGNPLSVKLRRDKVAEKTQLPMPVNKRNWRKQEVHLTVARAIQNVTDPNDGWRNKSGRPKGSSNKEHPKRDAVRSYAAAHPEANHSQIARALGVSRPTVIKWLKEWS